MSDSRMQQFQSISEFVLPNGAITRKLDVLGSVRIYGQYYFNVFRRYNSPYEIVVEDFAGDFHFHKDYTVRESLQKILCLSDEQMKGLHTIDAVSFKHKAVISEEVTNMRWTEIEHRWYALDMNLGGILESFHREVQQAQQQAQQQQQQQAQVPQAPLANRHILRMPRGTPVNLSDRFAAVDDAMVLRNGTRVQKPHVRR